MNDESPKFVVEEVTAVTPPPRARVESDETSGEKLVRKRDYLGVLTQHPPKS